MTKMAESSPFTISRKKRTLKKDGKEYMKCIPWSAEETEQFIDLVKT